MRLKDSWLYLSFNFFGASCREGGFIIQKQFSVLLIKTLIKLFLRVKTVLSSFHVQTHRSTSHHQNMHYFRTDAPQCASTHKFQHHELAFHYDWYHATSFTPVANTHQSKQPIIKRPIIIVLHGFLVHKQWGFFPSIGQYFSMLGYHTFIMNYPYDGYTSTSSTHSIVPEIFANNTITSEIQSIHALLDYLRSEILAGTHPIDKNTWDETFVLLGHSRGAGNAILIAGTRNDIKALALWSPISTFRRHSARIEQRWRAEGSLKIQTLPNKQELRINSTFLDDLEQNSERYSLLHAITKLSLPIFILTGSQDVTTPPKEAENLYSAYQSAPKPNNHSEFHIIEHTGHTFGYGDTPITTADTQLPQHQMPTKTLSMVLNLTNQFLEKYTSVLSD